MRRHVLLLDAPPERTLPRSYLMSVDLGNAAPP